MLRYVYNLIVSRSIPWRQSRGNETKPIEMGCTSTGFLSTRNQLVKPKSIQVAAEIHNPVDVLKGEIRFFFNT